MSTSPASKPVWTYPLEFLGGLFCGAVLYSVGALAVVQATPHPVFLILPIVLILWGAGSVFVKRSRPAGVGFGLGGVIAAAALTYLAFSELF